uniref:excisionase family DNA-binding protein n=1 Tax=Streptomyces sp. SJL17-4 TaxID=2967224 RepID=UPI00403FEE24
MDEVFLTVTEADARLNVGQDEIHRLVRDGVLKAIRVGRSVRIAEDSVLAYIQAIESEGADG